MNKFVYASLYYKKSHTTQLLSTQDKREMFRYSGYNNRSYRDRHKITEKEMDEGGHSY